MKKGQAQSFTWIFVMVLGVVILIGFVAFGLQYKSLTDDRNDLALLRAVDVMFEGLKDDNLYDEAAGVKINFIVGPGSISVGDFSREFGTSLIYGNVIDGFVLKAWSKEFLFPYKTASLLFLTDETTTYYFIGGGTELKSNLPDKIAEQVIITSSFPTTLAEKNKFVFFTEPGSLLSSAQEAGDVVVIKNNQILYYENGVHSYDVFDELLVYGAIFSNHAVFKSNYENLENRIKSMAQLYQERSVFLRGCSYSVINFEQLSAGNYNAVDSLSAQNQVLRNQNCLTLY